MPLLQPFVQLEPVAHKYFSHTGAEYMSVSKIYGAVKSEQDFEVIAYYSARKVLRVEYRTKETGIEPPESQILLRKKILQAQWAAKSKKSTDDGTEIHGVMEVRAKTLFPAGNQKYDEAAESVFQTYLSSYSTYYCEEVLYSKVFRAAGTADFLGVRKGGKSPVIDIIDYKTNSSKGVEFNSEYENRMKEPVAHLECCSYNHYCIQQSIYMRMLEEHGYTPGQIRLIAIPADNPMAHFPIPVPYMKREAEAILLHLHQRGVLRRADGQPAMV